MESIYEIVETKDCTYLERTDANGKIWSIPMDQANSDYASYLKYLEDNK
jgi:hypothetical protein